MRGASLRGGAGDRVSPRPQLLQPGDPFRICRDDRHHGILSPVRERAALLDGGVLVGDESQHRHAGGRGEDGGVVAPGDEQSRRAGEGRGRPRIARGYDRRCRPHAGADLVVQDGVAAGGVCPDRSVVRMEAHGLAHGGGSGIDECRDARDGLFAGRASETQ